MPGVKGRSGDVSDDLRAHCQVMLREHAVRKMDEYLMAPSKGPKDPAWRWVCETYAAWGAVETQQHELNVSGSLDLRAEAQAFTSRMDRLTSRLGTAAMPDGIT